MNEVVRALDGAMRWACSLVETGALPDAVVGIGSSAGSLGIEVVGDTDRSARYPLFSVTKPIVALAAARVIERGDVSLRAPLRDAVPGFGVEHQGIVRFEHLLSHTSGIAEPALDDARPLRGLLATADQQFLPGAAYRYSSLAFEGVAAILEHTTGRSLAEHVAELAGDGSISFVGDDAHPVARATDVGFDTAALFRQRHPGAGLFGSAGDMLALGARVLQSWRGDGDDLVAPSTMRGMLRARTRGLPEHVPLEERREYGLGWHLRQGSAGLLDDEVFGHAGWAGTQWWFWPHIDTCLVLMTSVAEPARWGVDADQLLNAVAAGRW